MNKMEVLRAHSVDKAALRRVSKPVCHPRETKRDHLLFAVSIGSRSPFALKPVPVSQAVEAVKEISGENSPALPSVLAPEIFMGREVTRCRHCHLNQFVTQNGTCRKCRQSLAPEPLPDIQPIIPTGKSKDEIADFGNLYDRVDMAFAVKLMRLMNGFSQKQLADRMESPRTYISKLENRKCVPWVGSIEKLAIALNVTPYILVTIAEAGCAA